ncbi:MAG: AAA family ATPase [Planctomycetes bacterium]|nr:AAA family ATPase [Planctomycetota bacterium]
MPGIEPLPPDQARRCCDADQFDFETTAELEPLQHSIGQERALEALHFGIGIQHRGFNMYLLGPSGTGKHTTACLYLAKRVAAAPVPDDWCYVHNFDKPNRPRALRLPAGRAIRLRQGMERFVRELRAAIPAAFSSDNYRARREAIEAEFKGQQDAALKALRARAEEKGIALVRTPAGLALAPVRDGEVLSQEEFAALESEERSRLEAELEALQGELEGILGQLPKWVADKQAKLRKLHREISRYAVGHQMDLLFKRYEDLPAVIGYLKSVQEDILENAEKFLPSGEGEETESEESDTPSGTAAFPGGYFRRYNVNVLVDHGGSEGAPVVYEDNPTHNDLLGRIEHLAHMGALLTDFNLIRPGALHRSNGGYLLLDAHKVLTQPYAWESLKRALRAGEIRIQSLAESVSVISTVTIDPEPIPLKVKIILVGERHLYYLLDALDPDFAELFKVPVDFADRLERTPDNAHLYARMVGTLVRNDKLRPFDRAAVSRVVEHAARLAEDAEKLSTHVASLADLVREADFWAGEAGRGVVTRADVVRAVEASIRRADRARERVHEQIHRGTVLIETRGARVGQVNGLSVLSLGKYAFGQPSRITARVRLGKGEVVDIEREVALGGPTHSKGVLILAGFLGGRFAGEHPLALSASLVFEQSYGGVDGDSASSAELYALLSALAEVPVRQALAVTGSINQHGQVQAIGGVNEKIEGFFDICRAGGLTGEQGVLIPASNVKHLMLREDVVEAIEAGRFRVLPVEHVDQGIELLTGVAAGERGADGAFPEGSINGRAEARLRRLAERARQFAAPSETKAGDGSG